MKILILNIQNCIQKNVEMIVLLDKIQQQTDN
jgi:hypothetical protein